ncbi:conjugal transfer protein TraI [Flavitalea sp. BT771]|uniref:conjugal transfer protein TraI n=1 Tax=Flavitalea sp. BT771 TaxID=3063329 RepID=UPI0026E211A0|nr:conjugal transfer protein TraI [Flavitalea sp. BT771]MDO6431564.1 conjugal transfer protein TraI [Flavitalea sp. BT771]MDV6220472.1 conjugal transfer protein TraI [Flavitalea sp. BT771]
MEKKKNCRTGEGVDKGRYAERDNRMGRRGAMVGLALLLACLAPGRSDAQGLDIISVINSAVKRVIVAMDLKIVRMQTETIGLQNEEKAAENEMQQSELSGIIGWVQEQRDLFAGYYQELREVKNIIAAYEEVKTMIDKQGKIIAGYQQAYAVLRQDKHFSADELSHLSAVLSGIARQSSQNLSRLTMVVTSLLTQMGDAGRLEIIDETGNDIDRNYRDLAQFSQESFLLSMQRARDANDIAVTRALYGMQ